MNHTSKIEVSIIVAVRNEQRYIRKCVDSLIDQDFPKDKYEIIIIDGMSNDNTRKILLEYTTKYPDLIRVFDNPKRFPGAGRNIGITNSKGKCICIVDGHAYADRKLLTKLLEGLDGSYTDIAGVGSSHKLPEDESFFGKIIAHVQSSILGGISTSFMPGKKSAYVKSLAFCIYRKEILSSVGLYDEAFIIGEDFELNWRIRKAGYKLLRISYALVFYYRKYDTLKLFSKRMINYGIWRTLITKKHPQSFPVLFIFPIILVISLFSLPIMFYFYSSITLAIICGIGLYLVGITLSSIHICITEKNFKSIISILFFLVEHVCFGIGLIAGIFKK